MLSNLNSNKKGPFWKVVPKPVKKFIVNMFKNLKYNTSKTTYKKFDITYRNTIL